MPPFRLPLRSRLLGWLQASLAIGAVYDLFFAGLMILAPELPQQMLGLAPPEPRYFLWLTAVFLTMLAGFYFFAAYDPVAYEGNILVAIAGRALGALAMGLAAWQDPSLGGLYVLAGGDLLFAAVHAALYLPLRPLVTH